MHACMHACMNAFICTYILLGMVVKQATLCSSRNMPMLDQICQQYLMRSTLCRILGHKLYGWLPAATSDMEFWSLMLLLKFAGLTRPIGKDS